MKGKSTLFSACIVGGMLTLQSAYAADSWRDNLKYQSDSGDFNFSVGGRLHYDTAVYNEDETVMKDDSDFRRARLNFSTSYGNWRGKYEYDFKSNEGYEVKGSYLGYYGFSRTRLKVGNLQQPIGLEELTSSNDITFMERSIRNVFSPSYHLGATVNHWSKHWSVIAGVFGDSLADRKFDNEGGESLAARFVWFPVKSSGNLLHFGVSGQLRNFDKDQRLSFRAHPETYLSSARLVATPTMRDLNKQTTLSLETALIKGPVSLQGEYTQVEVDPNQGQSLSFSGWYVQSSWFVTGEHRRYSRKSAAFSSVRPNSEYGAVELAVRYSGLDLTDGAVQGGEENNLTVGANWYINRYSRLMLNYGIADADPNRLDVQESASFVQARLQFVF